MEIVPTELPGVLLIQPKVHRDERGFFLESFRADAMRAAGVPVDFVQGNHSRSVKGTLRGLHFQRHPGQAKLVRCTRGAVWDVVVDIRPRSATFGRWMAQLLDDEGHQQLYIPVGFAHGFCVLSDVADFIYRVSNYYDPVTESGIAWNDPDLAIPWPDPQPILSKRDLDLPRLADVKAQLPDVPV